MGYGGSSASPVGDGMTCVPPLASARGSLVRRAGAGYWAAETYVHWIAARTLVQRDLNRDERRGIVRDGWPLMAASAVPLACLVSR